MTKVTIIKNFILWAYYLREIMHKVTINKHDYPVSILYKNGYKQSDYH